MNMKIEIQNFKNLGIFLLILILICSSLLALYWISVKYAAAIYYGNSVGNEVLVNLYKAASLDSNSDLYLRDLSRAILSNGNELINQDLSDDEKKAQVETLISDSVSLALAIRR